VKKFLILLKLEYEGMFLPLCIIVAIMVVLQPILFGSVLRGDYINAPFSHYVNSSRISAAFAIAYGGLLVLMGVRFLRNYTPSKSIYALLTIPVKRRDVYMAKLAAAAIAGFVLLAAQLILILFIFMQFQVFSQNADTRNADLYLSLLDVGFLRLLFPPDLFSLVFTLLGFFGSICVTFYVAVKLKSGGAGFAIILAAGWLALLLLIFPFGNFTWLGNFVALVPMFAVPIGATVRGIKLFESGEVAR